MNFLNKQNYSVFHFCIIGFWKHTFLKISKLIHILQTIQYITFIWISKWNIDLVEIWFVIFNIINNFSCFLDSLNYLRVSFWELSLHYVEKNRKRRAKLEILMPLIYYCFPPSGLLQNCPYTTCCCLWKCLNNISIPLIFVRVFKHTWNFQSIFKHSKHINTLF